MFYVFMFKFLSWFNVYYIKLLQRYNICVTGYMCGTMYDCDLEDSCALVYANPKIMVKREKCVGSGCCDGYKVIILKEGVEVKSTTFEE